MTTDEVTNGECTKSKAIESKSIEGEANNCEFTKDQVADGGLIYLFIILEVNKR